LYGKKIIITFINWETAIAMESAAGRKKVKVSKIDGGSIHTWRALNPDGCGRGCKLAL
jgi:hypothetical protein